MSNANPKAFCECKFKANEFYGLIGASETKGRPGIQYVHTCGRPTEMVWRGWLRKCATCWGLFSSPWSVLCKTCHMEECGAGATFHGWAWARMEDEKYRRKLLDAGARLRYDTEVGASHARSDPPH